MYRSITQTQLKSGEVMEIGVVEAPDPEWRARLVSFLGHKGPEWVPQIEMALSEPLDKLLSRFYVGTIDEQLACHTMVTASRSAAAALVSHVYTAPDQRRKGAIHALLTALMAECGELFQVMTLGAEYGSPAYRLYESLGFQSVAPERGEMVWSASGDWLLPPAPETAAEPTAAAAGWQDWPVWNWLAMQPVAPGECLPRSSLLGLYGQGSVEMEFIQWQMRRRREPELQAYSVARGNGPERGWALLAPGSEGVWRLDVHAGSGDSRCYSALLEAVRLPDASVECLISATEPGCAKRAALDAAGFEPEAPPCEWRDSSGRTRELIRLARRPQA